MSVSDRALGLSLALSSNLFIGISYIITKKGLINSDGRGQSHAYLKNYMWWAGTITMITGEFANFFAYSFIPAMLVTPLGALSVILSSILSTIFLKEKMGSLGKVGIALCILGSTTIILHSPEDTPVSSVAEILQLANNFAFFLYSIAGTIAIAVLIFYVSPRYGKKQILVYISICSLTGSFSVLCLKGFGIALKLTFNGQNQFGDPTTYILVALALFNIAIQLNYFNKALDIFSTNMVTPIYYVFFTTATIISSSSIFGTANTDPKEFISSLIGFIIIFFGVFILTRDKLQHMEAPNAVENKGARIRVGSKEGLTGDSSKRSSISIRKSSEIMYADFTTEKLGFSDLKPADSESPTLANQ